MKKFEKLAGGALGLLLPMMAMAAATNLTELGKNITTALNVVIGLLFIIVTVYFIWGVVQYVMAGGEEAKMKEGKTHMVWGIVAMGVMAGTWALVNILLNTLGITGGVAPTGIPTFR